MRKSKKELEPSLVLLRSSAQAAATATPPQTHHPPPQQGASSKLWVKVRAGVGGRGGLGPWDPPVGLGAVGLLKPSSSMGHGEKPGGETPQGALSRGGRQNGERKRLKSSSSLDEIWGLRENCPEKPIPSPGVSCQASQCPTYFPAQGGPTQDPKYGLSSHPGQVTLREKGGGWRQEPAGGLTASLRAGQSQEPATRIATCNVHGGQSPPSYRQLPGLPWDAAAAPGTEPGEPDQGTSSRRRDEFAGARGTPGEQRFSGGGQACVSAQGSEGASLGQV